MPFVSQAQRRFMHSQHPEIAKRWEKETKTKRLPERKKAKPPVKHQSSYTPNH